MGKNNKYPDAIKKEICDAIRQTSRGLKWLCEKNNHFPSYATIRMWIADTEDDAFCKMYAQAKIDQAHLLVEEMIDIADDVEPKEYAIKKAHERIDVRKFAAAKAFPKVYGDRVFNGKMDKEGEPIDEEPKMDLSKFTPEQLNAWRELTSIATTK